MQKLKKNLVVCILILQRIRHATFNYTLNNDPLGTKFESFIRKQKIEIEYYDDKVIELNNINIFVLTDKDDTFYAKLSTNNKSGVLKIVYGNTSFLFAGDVEKPAEDYYSNKYKNFLDADLLKVGHHGSKTSSTDNFLNYVSPKISLISAGIQNKFNHPSPEVLERLYSLNSLTYRTDESGGLLFQSDGDSIYYIDWKKYY